MGSQQGAANILQDTRNRIASISQFTIRSRQRDQYPHQIQLEVLVTDNVKTLGHQKVDLHVPLPSIPLLKQLMSCQHASTPAAHSIPRLSKTVSPIVIGNSYTVRLGHGIFSMAGRRLGLYYLARRSQRIIKTYRVQNEAGFRCYCIANK